MKFLGNTSSSIESLVHWPARGAAPGRYVYAAALVAAAAAVDWLLQPYLRIGSLVLPFLIAIMLAAIVYGRLPSLLASVLGVMAYDFFFLPPIYSLDVSDPDDVILLAVFATAALIVSNLAAYARAQTVTANLRAEVAEDLYQFGRQLAGAATLPEVLESSLPRLASLLRAPVQIVLPVDGGLAIHPSNPDAAAFIGTELASIKAWLLNDSQAGPDVPEPISSSWRLVPMRTGQELVGVMAIDRAFADNLLIPNPDALSGTLADLMAQAIHRIDLADDLTLATRAAEREKLHAALLASLSHDLRTPLSVVLAAAESLIDQPDPPAENTRQALTRTIRGEARRLDRYISDLLDMTRLEAGLADSTGGRIDLTDAVSVALDRCGSLAAHHVSVDIAPDLPLLAGDEVLLEHVLFNLLDNAAKYSPPGTMVELRAAREADTVVISIADEGDGVRPADMERIFDKFYRGGRHGPDSPGLGLGLAICRGYIEAMDGHISARNRTLGSGAVFTITLPVPETKDPPDLDA